jgi:hypothetical protein
MTPRLSFRDSNGGMALWPLPFMETVGTWAWDRQVRVTDGRQGQEKVFAEQTDSDMQTMCFDTHYALSGFDGSMSISQFRKLLQEKRRNIIESNFQQVSDYMLKLREQAASRGEYLRSGCAMWDLVETLVTPTDEALSSQLYQARKVAQVTHRSPFRMPRRERGHRQWVANVGQSAKFSYAETQVII